MTFTNDELMQLQAAAQASIYERGNKYGQIGLPSPTGFYIPTSERGKRFISVTLEDSTVILADSSKVLPIPSDKVRLRLEANVWVIKGADERGAVSGASNTSVGVGKHAHNIGAPPGLFYRVDPASINDGMLLPTGNGLEATVGRVTYPKSDGTIGIYDSNGTLNFASAVTGLSANESRWAIVYVDKSDGSVDYHIATAGSAPLDTTTDLEDAIAECLDNLANAYPYHAVRIGAGIITFGTYKAMGGRAMANKDFIRFVVPATDGNTDVTVLDAVLVDANGQILVDANGNILYGGL